MGGIMPRNGVIKATSYPKKDMRPIQYFNAGDLPPDAMQNVVTSINNSIKQYNNTQDSEKKLAILKEMQNEIQAFNYRYPMKMYENSMEYCSVQEALFTEIKYQYASLGQTSLLDPATKQPLLNEVIANMSPEKTNKLLSILDKVKSNKLGSELQTLYDVTDSSQEAQKFREFLKTHEITFLGGSNSKNFNVSRIADGHEAVLKVDNRLDMPRERLKPDYAITFQKFLPL